MARLNQLRVVPRAEEGRVAGLPAAAGAAAGGSAHIGTGGHRLPGDAHRWVVLALATADMHNVTKKVHAAVLFVQTCLSNASSDQC